MVDEEQSTLTPNEAGAFVAQWAERRKIDVSELAERLGVDSSHTESLLRQARGRLHMQDWLLDHRPKTKIWNSWVLPSAAALVLGGIGGCLIMKYLTPPPEPPPLQAPHFQVESTDNSPNPDKSPVLPHIQPGMPPQSDSTGPAGQLSGAVAVGTKVGRILGQMTAGGGDKADNPRGRFLGGQPGFSHGAGPMTQAR